MRTSRHFLTLLSAFLCFLTIDSIIVKQENSLFGPYQAGVGHLMYWDLSGSSQLAETAIRLTTDEPGKQGAIWNNYPMHSNDWEFHVQFHIHGKGVHLNGNGMAFWYVRDPLHAGPVFGSKDYWSGLGIFIDTFENAATPHHHLHPYLSAVVNNGSFPYYHNEYGTAGQVGGCHLQSRNLEWPTKVAISYIADALTVYIDTQGNGQWGQCFRAEGVHLPTGYNFGISASTSEYSDNHDVVSVTTLDNIIPDKVWEDRSHLIPSADFLELPYAKFQQQFIPEEHFQKVEHQQAIPEIKIEPPQEVIAETEPEMKFQQQKVKVEPAPQVKVEPKAHMKVEPQQQLKVEPQPQLKVEPQPQVKVEPQPQVKVEPQPQVKDEPQAHMKVQPEPKVEPQSKKKEPHPKAKEPQPKPQVQEGPKIEPVKESQVSWLRKVLYMTGIGILLYVAITMFRKYSAQRRERMQKRLY